MERTTTETAEKDESDALVPAINYRGWKAMPYVIGNEAFEKLGSLGTASNLLVYLTTVFNMENVAAATLLNVFNGTTNLATILGAFLSDTYLGRYTTLGFACIASLLGMFIITLTAAIPKLHPPECDQGQTCTSATPWQLFVLISSFVFLVVGAGGIRPCNLAFGADQFDPQTESGKRGISSFFNWYYFTFTFAIVISSTVIIYVQSSVSWALGLAIPTAVMLFSCVVFFLGTKLYVKVRPDGSPITSVAQVLVAAFIKRGLEQPEDPKQSLFNPPRVGSINSKLPYSDQFRFLDKASIITMNDEIKANGQAEKRWRLCTLQQVEEVKCLLRIIPIWSTSIMYNIAAAQQYTFVVLEALQSDRHLGKSSFQIPAASFTIFNLLALSIWIPVYDRIIVPRLQKMTGREGGISLLQRISIGNILSIIAMVVSALVEERRRYYALHRPNIGIALRGGAISSMSSLWLIPQVALLGLADGFSSIGQVEFYYKQFPENMRSIAGCLVFCGIAISNYLSGFLITIVHRSTGGEGEESWLAQDLNKGRLDYFYYLIAVGGVINLAYFIVCAVWYRYKVLDDAPEIALEHNQGMASQV